MRSKYLAVLEGAALTHPPGSIILLKLFVEGSYYGRHFCCCWGCATDPEPCMSP